MMTNITWRDKLDHVGLREWEIIGPVEDLFRVVVKIPGGRDDITGLAVEGVAETVDQALCKAAADMPFDWDDVENQIRRNRGTLQALITTLARGG